VGWICALPTEMAAAQAMLDDIHPPLPQNASDRNNYTLGRMGVHNVVMACLPAGVMGTVSAARVANNMLSTFKWLRFGLMVGIGGGVPVPGVRDIRLGDVVVGEPRGLFGGVIQYDFGKAVHDHKFVRTGSLNRPPDILLTAVSRLQADHYRDHPKLGNYLEKIVTQYPMLSTDFSHPGVEHDFLYPCDYDHNPSDDEEPCKQCDSDRLVQRMPRNSHLPFIHYGLIASGNQVMRNGETRDRLRKDLDVLCFEMEAAGLMDVFPCLVIRGICDYSDSHKNKKWQGYAAATAAAYAKELLSVISGNQIESAEILST
jgi:nucleoside phosphorylase